MGGKGRIDDGSYQRPDLIVISTAMNMRKERK